MINNFNWLINDYFRADISKQSKDIESLRKKIISLDSVKQGLEKDKERFKQDLYKKNKVQYIF